MGEGMTLPAIRRIIELEQGACDGHPRTGRTRPALAAYRQADRSGRRGRLCRRPTSPLSLIGPLSLPAGCRGPLVLPTAELHIHIEGTLEPEMLVRLAARNGVALPTTDVSELRSRYRFADLQSFLDLYYANLPVLRTEADFYDLARPTWPAPPPRGVRRAEIFFDPQTHLANGVPLEAVFGGTVGRPGRRRRPARRLRGPHPVLPARPGSRRGRGRRWPPRCRSASTSSASASTPPRSAIRPRSSATSSRARRPNGSAWSPTLARRAAPATSGKPWTSSPPSASTTGSGPWRIRA